MDATDRPTDESLLLAAQPAIERTARRMKWGPLFARESPDDLESDLRLALIIRLPKFDPARGRFGAFVARVLRSASVDTIRHRRRNRRRIAERTFLAEEHHALVDQATGHKRAISEADGARARGGAKSGIDRDAVRDAIELLPDELRDLARRLSTTSSAAVARQLGVGPHQMRKLRARLAASLIDRGIDQSHG